MLYHDLGLRFNSPTVNLYIPFPDYIKFCQNLEHYLSLPIDAMVEGPIAPEGCPTGILEDMRLVFAHYKSFDEARNKWYERAKRVDMNNLYIMLAQRDGCSADDVRAFDAVTYGHKLAFTAEPMQDVQCAAYVPEFVQEGEVRVLTYYVSHFTGRRIMDAYDCVNFLNEGH